MKRISYKNRKKHIMFVLLTLIPVLAVSAAIYYFSSETAEESAAQSEGITAAVIKITVPEYDTLPPEQQQEEFSEVHHAVRKTAHFSEFCALGFFLVLFLYCCGGKLWILPASAAHCSLYAFFDEFLHQSQVSGRAPGITDVLIDSSGGLTGSLLMLAIILIAGAWVKKKKKNKNTAVSKH